MRTVVAVDWSDQAFNAVRVVSRLFVHEELTLIHAVDLRPIENPIFAQPIGRRTSEEVRHSMMEAAERLLDQTGAMVPPTVPSAKRVYRTGSPAKVILETVRSTQCELVAVGSQGRGRVAELILGSVSHRVVLHAPCASLLVRGDPGKVQSVLLAVEGQEDSQRLVAWLHRHRFAQRVSLSLLSVAPSLHTGDDILGARHEKWIGEIEQYAEQLVKDTAASLRDLFPAVMPWVERGDPARCIAQAARQADLVVLGSHGWKGMGHFLLGSVSHAVLHQVACPVLIVR
ncbi:MAG: universal stress protein [Nitrospiraceae bacterium]